MPSSLQKGRCDDVAAAVTHLMPAMRRRSGCCRCQWTQVGRRKAVKIDFAEWLFEVSKVAFWERESGFFAVENGTVEDGK
jgi:hypothetical protein